MTNLMETENNTSMITAGTEVLSKMEENTGMAVFSPGEME